VIVCRASPYFRHLHHRYVELKLRITKTGVDTGDVMTLRLFSYFSTPSAADQDDESITAFVHCPSEPLNIPQLMQPLILAAGRLAAELELVLLLHHGNECQRHLALHPPHLHPG